MDFEKLTKNQIEDIYRNTVERYGREFVQEAGYYDDLWEMYEIDELLRGKSPSEILRKLSSDFNCYDNYFYINGYGYLCSTNSPIDYYDTNICMDDYVQWFVSNYEAEAEKYIEVEDERAN